MGPAGARAVVAVRRPHFTSFLEVSGGAEAASGVSETSFEPLASLSLLGFLPLSSSPFLPTASSYSAGLWSILLSVGTKLPGQECSETILDRVPAGLSL